MSPNNSMLMSNTVYNFDVRYYYILAENIKLNFENTNEPL